MTLREQAWISLAALTFVQPACVLPPDAGSETRLDSGNTENEVADDARSSVEDSGVASQYEAGPGNEDGPEMAEGAGSSAPDGRVHAMGMDGAAIGVTDAGTDAAGMALADTGARRDSGTFDASVTTSGGLCTYGS